MTSAPPQDEAPVTFDFITDERFRAALEADYAELNASLAAQTSKAVLVLAGSIIEAVLVDYLQSTGQKKPNPLAMDLSSLIDACTQAGVLTAKTAELSSVVRSYRNLIHPGRIVRLDETFGRDDAIVASHVVNIILRDVARALEADFGLTATQLVTKFEADHNAPAIASLLVREMRPQELRRLVVDVVPARYFEHQEAPLWDTDNSATLARLALLHRTAFDEAPRDVRAQAASRFVAVLREGAGGRVEVYGECFFRGGDLQYLPDSDRQLVIAHVLGRLRTTSSRAKLLSAAVGMEHHLSPDQFNDYVGTLLVAVAYDEVELWDDPAWDSVIAADRNSDDAQRERLRARIKTWASRLAKTDQQDRAERMERLLSVLEADDDIPF